MYFVVAGAGEVGLHLSQALLEAGHEVTILEAEIAPGSPPAGKTIGALRLPAGALVGGIVRKGKLMAADDETKFEVGDRVIVLSPEVSESEVRKALFG